MKTYKPKSTDSQEKKCLCCGGGGNQGVGGGTHCIHCPLSQPTDNNQREKEKKITYEEGLKLVGKIEKKLDNSISTDFILKGNKPTNSISTEGDWEEEFYREFRDLMEFGKYDAVKDFISSLLIERERAGYEKGTKDGLKIAKIKIPDNVKITHL